MRNFWLKRIEDESGVSGVGVVAEGTQFENGKCVLAWVTQFQSVAVYDSIEELERIHGHNGKTLVVWAQPTKRALDDVPPQEAGDLTPADVHEKMAQLPKPRRQ